MSGWAELMALSPRRSGPPANSPAVFFGAAGIEFKGRGLYRFMIQIPNSAKIVRDSRLNLVRIIKTLDDQYLSADGGIVDQIKETMAGKKAEFAESDLVVAELRPGDSKGTIDPRKALNALLLRGFNLDEFLKCVNVCKKNLKPFLSEMEIEAITEYPKTKPTPKLVTEFKAAFKFEPASFAGVIQDSLQKFASRG